MLNWFTHNSYVELPMSQHMALYFDSRAERGVSDAISGIGQVLTSTKGLMGIGGIIGAFFGGPKLGIKRPAPLRYAPEDRE